MTKKKEEVGSGLNPGNVERDPFDGMDDNDWKGEGWETASAIIWQPEEGGELQGFYDGNEPFTEGTLDTEVLKHYVVERGSHIRHSFVGGQVFDKTIAKAKLEVGDLVKIVFIGQKDCKAGRVNLFDIKFRRK